MKSEVRAPAQDWLISSSSKDHKRSLADTDSSAGPAGNVNGARAGPMVSSIIPHCLPQTEKRDFPPIKSREALQVCVNSCFHGSQQLNLVGKTAQSRET